MILRTLLPAFLLLALVGRLSAQIPIEFAPGSAELSRQELERLLAQYHEAIASPAYSSRVKDAARTSARRIEERLELGDFRVGDRVAIRVQGENNLPDTVVVEQGPQITLPLFGSISLAGVLRSEIQPYLTQELGKVIHDPVVRAQGLVRLSIQGSVGRPGFYVMPADLLVSDVLMRAGGPGRDANLDALRLERGTTRLVEGQAMQEALLDGRTLDQLNVRAGDQIFLPQKRGGGLGRILRYTGVITSLTWLVIRIAR